MAQVHLDSKKILRVGLLFFAVFLVTLVLIKKSNNKKASTVFITSSPLALSSLISISEYDLKSNTITDTFKYDLPSDLADPDPSQGSSLMFNDKKLYFVLKNFSDYDGELINKQEPRYLIRSVDMSKSETPAIIYKTDSTIEHWIIDKIKNVIYLQEQDDNFNRQLFSIDLGTNQKKLLVSYSKDKYPGQTTYHPLVLSKDGKYVYQTVNAWTNPGRDLFLNRINLTDNTVDTFKVFQNNSPVTWPAETRTTISPDNKYLAFLYEAKIYFWNIKDQSIFNTCSIKTGINNMNFVWSGESKTVYTLSRNSINSCQIGAKESKTVVSVSNPHFLSVIQPTDYVLYKGEGTTGDVLYSYNKKNNKNIEIQIVINDWRPKGDWRFTNINW